MYEDPGRKPDFHGYEDEGLDLQTIVRWGLLAAPGDEADPLLYQVLDRLATQEMVSKMTHDNIVAIRGAVEHTARGMDELTNAITTLTGVLANGGVAPPQGQRKKGPRKKPVELMTPSTSTNPKPNGDGSAPPETAA
jgi:hypothetical protein